MGPLTGLVRGVLQLSEADALDWVKKTLEDHFDKAVKQPEAGLEWETSSQYSKELLQIWRSIREEAGSHFKAGLASWKEEEELLVQAPSVYGPSIESFYSLGVPSEVVQKAKDSLLPVELEWELPSDSQTEGLDPPPPLPPRQLERLLAYNCTLRSWEVALPRIEQLTRLVAHCCPLRSWEVVPPLIR